MKYAAAVLSLLAQAAPTEDLSRYQMEPMGWVFMIGSIAAVVGLAGFCYWKVLTSPRPPGHMHAPLDIDTHDRGT